MIGESTEFTIKVEVKDDIGSDSKFGIEDAVTDALNNLGYDVTEVRVIW